jgi:cytoplasmic iron level regulating protein YaaA (DUF328/UPF0246 family)
MKNFYILIPPSEGKEKGGTFPSIKKTSKDFGFIVKQLLDLDGGNEKLLGVKAKALEEAIEANKSILKTKTMPAIERYKGVVYKGLDYPSLDQKAKNFFDKHVRIVSAVFGLVNPTSLIPDYKLKIDKLGADKYWRSINQKILGNSFVVDLLPQAHKKAVEFDSGTSIDFVIKRNNKKIPAGHNGKFIKGRFVRFLCENQITDPTKMHKFNEDGFTWNKTCFLKESS